MLFLEINIEIRNNMTYWLNKWRYTQCVAIQETQYRYRPDQAKYGCHFDDVLKVCITNSDSLVLLITY